MILSLVGNTTTNQNVSHSIHLVKLTP